MALALQVGRLLLPARRRDRLRRLLGQVPHDHDLLARLRDGLRRPRARARARRGCCSASSWWRSAPAASSPASRPTSATSSRARTSTSSSVPSATSTSPSTPARRSRSSSARCSSRTTARRLAFGMPAAMMFVATLVFWMGRKKFAVVPPAGKAWLRRRALDGGPQDDRQPRDHLPLRRLLLGALGPVERPDLDAAGRVVADGQEPRLRPHAPARADPGRQRPPHPRRWSRSSRSASTRSWASSSR